MTVCLCENRAPCACVFVSVCKQQKSLILRSPKAAKFAGRSGFLERKKKSTGTVVSKQLKPNKNVENHQQPKTNRPTARDHGQRRNWPPPGLLRISNQPTNQHTHPFTPIPPPHHPLSTFLLLAFCVLFLFASPQVRQREKEYHD